MALITLLKRFTIFFDSLKNSINMAFFILLDFALYCFIFKKSLNLSIFNLFFLFDYRDMLHFKKYKIFQLN